jgi:hypothetical protein
VRVPINQRTAKDQKRIAEIMRLIGFKRQAVRPKGGGEVEKGWAKDKSLMGESDDL